MNLKNNQFVNNLGIIDDKEFNKIQSSHVLIVGLGGIGGNFVNNIVRLGIKNITLIDFDKFEISNLNRQLFSNYENIAKYKVNVVRDELLKINPNCNINLLIDKIENVDAEHFKKIDYIVDAVDTPKTKIYISELSNQLNIPLLHGACAGWYGQIGWILPGCNLIAETYKSRISGLEDELLNPSFTPSAIASMMTSEFVKFIIGSNETVINELLLIDLYNNNTIKTGDKNG